MAIIQAGKQFTAEDIQRTAGELAALIRDCLARGNAFRIQLESWPDADLLTLEGGLSQEEINAIKGFYVGDLPTLYNAFAGSTWVKQLLGTGV
jgi:hypothetical protein